MYQINKITSDTVVDFAAEELKKYLRMMMPECGEIFIKYAPDAKDGFRLGVMSDLGLDTSAVKDTVLDDIIHIDTDSSGGIISGSNPRSVLLAVYRYLTLNGCRWLFPGIDGEFIPICDIAPTKYHKAADNRYRGQCNEGAEYEANMMEVIDFTPKLGLNAFMLEFDIPYAYYDWYYSHEANVTNREPEPVTMETVLQWKRQCEAEIAKRGLQFHDMGHGWTFLPFGMKMHGSSEDMLLPEEYRKYMAKVDGVRELTASLPHRTNFCMSNPEARRYVVDYITSYAKKHQNLTCLHIDLADSRNRHCECESCRKKTPSDWYVVLLNETDAALTKLGLSTKLEFCGYEDTVWPAKEETLKNPSRFLFKACPIWRDYTEPVEPNIPAVEYAPYVLNKNEAIKDIKELMTCYNEWKARNGMDSFIYDYHFWTHQCLEVGGLDLARVIHGDVRGFKRNGFQGMIEDGSQRSFFPNGFPFFVYASTLFDDSVDFEELKRDYFSHAYGEDYETVIKLLYDLGNAFSHKYLEGKMSSDPEKGIYFNPTHASSLRRVRSIVAEFEPFLTAHLNMPYRAQTVAYRILRRYCQYSVMLAHCLTLKCVGANEEAVEAYTALLNDFGKYELEIERYYDQSLYGMTHALYIDMFRGAIANQKSQLNVQ